MNPDIGRADRVFLLPRAKTVGIGAVKTARIERRAGRMAR
jgi:hypothetical protein